MWCSMTNTHPSPPPFRVKKSLCVAPMRSCLVHCASRNFQTQIFRDINTTSPSVQNLFPDTFVPAVIWHACYALYRRHLDLLCRIYFGLTGHCTKSSENIIYFADYSVWNSLLQNTYKAVSIVSFVRVVLIFSCVSVIFSFKRSALRPCFVHKWWRKSTVLGAVSLHRYDDPKLCPVSVHGRVGVHAVASCSGLTL